MIGPSCTIACDERGVDLLWCCMLKIVVGQRAGRRRPILTKHAEPQHDGIVDLDMPCSPATLDHVGDFTCCAFPKPVLAPTAFSRTVPRKCSPVLPEAQEWYLSDSTWRKEVGFKS